MAAHQAPPSLGFSRQEHWSGLPFPSPMHESGKWKVKVESFSHVWLFVTPWTAAYQAPPSMGFSGQEYWSGVPLPFPHPYLLDIYFHNDKIYIGFWENKNHTYSVLWCNPKNDRMISVHFQGKPFNITVIQVYAPTSNAEEADIEWFYEDLEDLLELAAKKRCSFHYRGLECKSRKSRNTRSNRKIWPRSTEWSRAKPNRVLPRVCTVHSKYPLPTI